MTDQILLEVDLIKAYIFNDSKCLDEKLQKKILYNYLRIELCRPFIGIDTWDTSGIFWIKRYQKNTIQYGGLEGLTVQQGMRKMTK